MMLRPPSSFQTAASCFNLQPRCTKGASSQILLRCYLRFDLNRISVHLISTVKLRLNHEALRTERLQRTALSSTLFGSATKSDCWGRKDLPYSAAAEVSTAEKTGPLNAVESTSKSAPGIEDLFNDSFSVTPSLAPAKPQKDVKNDIMSLFEKSNIVSPFAMHQQQLAMLAQQQSLLMAATSKSNGVDLKYPTGLQQPSSNVSVQNWPHTGFPISGVMPMASQGERQKLMQTRNMTPAHPAGNSVQHPPSGFYAMGQVGPVNGMMTMGVRKPQSSPVPSTTSKSTKEYDFSSLTQGMFAKQ